MYIHTSALHWPVQTQWSVVDHGGVVLLLCSAADKKKSSKKKSKDSTPKSKKGKGDGDDAKR